MKKKLILHFFLAASFFANAQPANDDPCVAITLAVSGNADNCAPIPYTYSTPPTASTISLPPLPAGGCGFSWADPSTSPDVWYKFQPTTGEVNIVFRGIHNATSGYGYTDYVVYKGSNCNGPFNYVGCGTAYGLVPTLVENLDSTAIYYLRVFLAPINTGTHDICLFTDMPSLNSRVGINFTSPQKSLDVAGETQFRHNALFKRNLVVHGTLTTGIGSLSRLSLGSQLGNRLGLWGDMNGNHYGLGISGGLLQVYSDANASNIAFGYGHSNSFTENVRFTGNGNVGIGNSSPTARLSISSTGTELTGAALSSILKTNAGSLSVGLGNEINLASIGFVAGGNNTALGIRAYRSTAGTDWTSTAILLEYDVDNTTRASGGFLAFRANGNIGIGTTTPNAPLGFPTALGKKISFYSGGNGDAAIGVFGNELRIQSDYPNADITFGNDNISTGYRENMRLSNPTGALHVRGNVFANSTFYSSDLALKQNIQPITNALSRLQQINGYSYEWKDTSLGEGMQNGVIAQEVQGIFPGLVMRNQFGSLSVNYTGLVPVLLEAIKEQQKQIDELRKLVEQLIKQ